MFSRPGGSINPNASDIWFLGVSAPSKQNNPSGVNYTLESSTIDKLIDYQANNLIDDKQFTTLLNDHRLNEECGEVLLTYVNDNGNLCTLGHVSNNTEVGRKVIRGIANGEIKGMSVGMAHAQSETDDPHPIQYPVGRQMYEISVTHNPLFDGITNFKTLSETPGYLLEELAKQAASSQQSSLQSGLSTTIPNNDGGNNSNNLDLTAASAASSHSQPPSRRTYDGRYDSSRAIKKLPTPLRKLPDVINHYKKQGKIFTVNKDTKRCGPARFQLVDFYTQIKNSQPGNFSSLDKFFSPDPHATLIIEKNSTGKPPSSYYKRNRVTHTQWSGSDIHLISSGELGSESTTTTTTSTSGGVLNWTGLSENKVTAETTITTTTTTASGSTTMDSNNKPNVSPTQTPSGAASSTDTHNKSSPTTPPSNNNPQTDDAASKPAASGTQTPAAAAASGSAGTLPLSTPAGGAGNLTEQSPPANNNNGVKDLTRNTNPALIPINEEEQNRAGKHPTVDPSTLTANDFDKLNSKDAFLKEHLPSHLKYLQGAGVDSAEKLDEYHKTAFDNARKVAEYEKREAERAAAEAKKKADDEILTNSRRLLKTIETMTSAFLPTIKGNPELLKEYDAIIAKAKSNDPANPVNLVDLDTATNITTMASKAIADQSTQEAEKQREIAVKNKANDNIKRWATLNGNYTPASAATSTADAAAKSRAPGSNGTNTNTTTNPAGEKDKMDVDSKGAAASTTSTTASAGGKKPEPNLVHTNASGPGSAAASSAGSSGSRQEKQQPPPQHQPSYAGKMDQRFYLREKPTMIEYTTASRAMSEAAAAASSDDGNNNNEASNPLSEYQGYGLNLYDTRVLDGEMTSFLFSPEGTSATSDHEKRTSKALSEYFSKPSYCSEKSGDKRPINYNPKALEAGMTEFTVASRSFATEDDEDKNGGGDLMDTSSGGSGNDGEFNVTGLPYYPGYASDHFNFILQKVRQSHVIDATYDRTLGGQIKYYASDATSVAPVRSDFGSSYLAGLKRA